MMLLKLFFFLTLGFLKDWGTCFPLAGGPCSVPGPPGLFWTGQRWCALLDLLLLTWSEGLLGESVVSAGSSACHSSQHGLLHQTVS